MSKRRHKTVPLASGNLQGLCRAMVTVTQRCHRGMAWGHCHLQQDSGVLLLPAGRADAQPSITKGSSGSSLASSAAKTRGNQKLLLLLRFSATCPHSVQDLAPVGMHPCIPSKTQQTQLLVQTHPRLAPRDTSRQHPAHRAAIPGNPKPCCTSWCSPAPHHQQQHVRPQLHLHAASI